MKEIQSPLRAGDLVQVLSAAEIDQTLGVDGTLDGLPFMPEMLEFCGKQFHVFRRVEKTCIDMQPLDMREFKNNDVVFLDGLRCSGLDHGGCQRVCMLFWKEAWLRKMEGEKIDSPSDTGGIAKIRGRLNTITGSDRFVCQSSEILKATRPLGRIQRIWKCFRDVRLGTYSPLWMLGLILIPLGRKIRRKFFGDPQPRGDRKPTPAETLHLQPGEWVEVKSIREIERTLDCRGKNRGMYFSSDMRVFCGRRFRVRGRVEKMIAEGAGQMRELKDTVILDGVTCGCPYAVGGCPRCEILYWREIWLKRVPSK